jgi:elongation factor P--(R)-beta-lysine ligase
MINHPPFWKERIQSPRRKKALTIRNQVEYGIRDFFIQQDFLETRTPLLVPCPGMEPHIRPFKLEGNSYLPTSPELAMKRLLVGGLKKIFQLSPAFRNEPRSPHHLPEFTLLEWYRSQSSYETIMKDTEALFSTLALKMFGKPMLHFQGRKISVAPPWPRLRIRDLFYEKAQINLVQKQSTSLLTLEMLRDECKKRNLSISDSDQWDDLFFKIWFHFIEPQLPQDQAVFIDRYPASQAALSVLDQDPDGSLWAKRFEVFAGGLELGNAFEELTDPLEQRRRFEKDMELRAALYGPSFPKTPLDEGFLEALQEGMPPSAGIAIGVDRLVMLFADEPHIDQTIWIEPYHHS